MVGILEDKDRIFTNLYGFHDPMLEGARKRGAWNATADILGMGRDQGRYEEQAGDEEPGSHRSPPDGAVIARPGILSRPFSA